MHFQIRRYTTTKIMDSPGFFIKYKKLSEKFKTYSWRWMQGWLIDLSGRLLPPILLDVCFEEYENSSNHKVLIH